MKIPTRWKHLMHTRGQHLVDDPENTPGFLIYINQLGPIYSQERVNIDVKKSSESKIYWRLRSFYLFGSKFLVLIFFLSSQLYFFSLEKNFGGVIGDSLILPTHFHSHFHFVHSLWYLNLKKKNKKKINSIRTESDENVTRFVYWFWLTRTIARVFLA